MKELDKQKLEAINKTAIRLGSLIDCLIRGVLTSREYKEYKIYCELDYT